MPRYVLQGIGPPYSKQQEIMSYVLRPDPLVVKKVNVRCGIAVGKSTCGIDLATRVLSLDGNQAHLFLEPDRNRMENVFLFEWEKIVPKELYDISYGDRTIYWKPTGSRLIYWHRDIRGNKRKRANMFRGINVTSVQDDEAPEEFLLEQWQNTFNRIRTPSPVRFYLTWGTPQPGEYSMLLEQPDQKLFTGTSYDNPYLPAGYIEGMMANMSRDQIRREIYGEMIALEGRIFKDALVDLDNIEHQWPEGNVHWEHRSFRKGQPWWLFADLGSATGAYTVVQREPAPPGWGGHIWIAVADYCPQTDASAARALDRLDMEFGPPVEVVAGLDVNTKSAADGSTVANIVDQIWGYVPVHPVSEVYANKQLQFNRMEFLIREGVNGHRRFCVAKDFVSLDKYSRRGVIPCLKEYQYRPVHERKDGEFLPKGSDQPLCHVADTLLMGAVQTMAPPRWLKTNERVRYE